MALSITQKDFLVAWYAQLLHQSNIVLIGNYLNFDKSLKQVRKELFKQQIFVEVLSSKVFSRNFFPLGGPHIMFLISSFDQLMLIPEQYRKQIRLVITQYNVYPYSLFEEALKLKFPQPTPSSAVCAQNTLIVTSITNMQCHILANTFHILGLNNAHS